MKLKRLIYYVSKFTLLDEILDFIYLGLAIYGIIVIPDYIKNETVVIVALLIYMILVAIIYITIVKKIKLYFKNSA
jgi:hypothetical protein